jgi:hypothetical protein
MVVRSVASKFKIPHRVWSGSGVLSPDPATTPGCPVPGGYVRRGARPHRPVAPRGAYPQEPLRAARRPRPAQARPAPRLAAAPDNRPLAPAHTPAAPAHRPAQHPDDDVQALEPASRQQARRRVGGSARYVGGTGRLPIRRLNDAYLVPEAPQSRVALEYRLTAHHRP